MHVFFVIDCGILSKENLDLAELVANDFGRRFAGSKDSSHVVKTEYKNTFSCHTFSGKLL